MNGSSNTLSNSLSEAVSTVFDVLCDSVRQNTPPHTRDTVAVAVVAQILANSVPKAAVAMADRARCRAITACPLLLRRKGVSPRETTTNIDSRQHLSRAAFASWIAAEFVSHSTSNVFALLTHFGFYMRGLNLAYDPAAARVHLLHVSTVGGASIHYPMHHDDPALSITLRQPSGKFYAAAVDALHNVFEHFSRRHPSSPYVASGNGVLAASPECVTQMLIQSGWRERHSLSPSAVVHIVWTELERRHVAMRPFKNGVASVPSHQLIMTFEADVTFRGFLLFVGLLEDLFGKKETSQMMHVLGFTTTLLHAINRGSMDNVHRSVRSSCPCASRESGHNRLLQAEERRYRSTVETQLRREDEPSLSCPVLVSSNSSQLSDHSPPPQRLSLKSDEFGPFVHGSSSLHLKSNTTLGGRRKHKAPHTSLTLSASVRGKGPLLAPLDLPGPIAPSRDAIEKAQRRRRERRESRRREKAQQEGHSSTTTTTEFSVSKCQSAATQLYQTSGAVMTLTPLQRSALHIATE